MKFRSSLLVPLFIAASALTLPGCGSSVTQSPPQTVASRPAADLMAPPGRFSLPPTTVDPSSGKPTMTGSDALPWALETLDIGGDIRARFLRLQAWVRTILGSAEAPPK